MTSQRDGMHPLLEVVFVVLEEARGKLRASTISHRDHPRN